MILLCCAPLHLKAIVMKEFCAAKKSSIKYFSAISDASNYGHAPRAAHRVRIEKLILPMKKIFTLTLLMGLGYTVCAQKMSKGFIVTAEKDTLYGLIQDGIDAELSQKVVFQKDGQSTEYTPADLIGFGLHYGRTFQRFAFDPSQGNDSIAFFAKKNIGGKIDLYTRDINGQKQPDIVLKNNSTGVVVHMIPPKDSKKTVNGVQYVNTSYRHLGLMRLAKGDSVSSQKSQGRSNYNEQAISREIGKYNKRFREDFPVTHYKPQVERSYNISAGMMVVATPGSNPSVSDANSVRVSFYRHQTPVERSQRIRIIQGVAYRYRKLQEPPYPSYTARFSLVDAAYQYLTIIPLGASIESKGKFVRPYAFVAPGFGMMVSTIRVVKEYFPQGNVHEVQPVFTFHTGAGLKIKMGSHFILTEVTFSGDGGGLFVNAGYSF